MCKFECVDLHTQICIGKCKYIKSFKTNKVLTFFKKI